MTQVVAVDWSGRKAGEAEAIWLAVARWDRRRADSERPPAALLGPQGQQGADRLGAAPAHRTRSRRQEHFQIGGAGSVGTGSIRGMPHLLRLAKEGWSIWPFDEPSWPLAVEIYPRLLTGPVIKSRRCERERAARDLPAWAGRRATESEDALDAALSALAMSRARWDLPPARDEQERLEGAIWRPGPG